MLSLRRALLLAVLVALAAPAAAPAALYVNGAAAAGVEPLVTFEHARGGAEICNQRKHRRKKQCRLPTPKQYERAFRLFRARFPLVRTFAPWNEINHFTQLTFRHPKAAARFTDIARRNCRGCKIVVADILDAADSTRAKKPRYRSALRYIKRFKRALKAPRFDAGLVAHGTPRPAYGEVRKRLR